MKAAGAFVLIAASMFGCGENQERVAGGGSDQPNKIQAGRVMTDSGKPASGVQVVSWAGEWNPVYSNQAAQALDTTVTDPQGNWSLRIPDVRSWYVVASSPGYRAVALPGQSEIRLSAEARLYGKITRPRGLVIESIWVGGTGQILPIHWFNDSYGDFYATLMPGAARIWAKVSWKTGSDTILLTERYLEKGDNPPMDLTPDTANTLLLSAEADPIRSALRGVDYDIQDNDAGQWFTATDADWGGTSSISPAGFPDSTSAVKTSPFGRYFSWSMELGEPLQFAKVKPINPWAGVGVRLSRRDMDWSRVDSLQLYVRGGSNDTKVWIQLNSSEVDRIGGAGQFRHLLTLPSGWSRLPVRLQDFRAPPGSKSDSLKWNWDNVKHSIHDIVFFAASPKMSFELIEVRALGSRRQNW
ncbi:MAG: hypothetical protein RL173_2618 [Fibrobacterota bacterium]|jgi:hypothetical protein